MQLDHFCGYLLLCFLPLLAFGQLQSTVREVAGCARGGSVFGSADLLIPVFYLPEYGAICIVEDINDRGIGRHSSRCRDVQEQTWSSRTIVKPAEMPTAWIL